MFRLVLVPFFAVCALLGAFVSDLCAHQEYSVQIEQLSEQIAAEPTNAALYFRRGELLGFCNSIELARADLRKCREIDSSRVDTHLIEGRMLYDVRRYPEASKSLKLFLSHSPNHPEGMLCLARVFVELGRRAEAERLYEGALRGMNAPEPDKFIEWADYVMSDVKQQRTEAAIAILDQGIERLGPAVTLQLSAIELETKLGNYESAIKRLDTIMAQSPRKDAWLERKAEFLIQSGRPAEARIAIESALAEIAGLPSGRRTSQSVIEREANLRGLLSQVSLNHLEVNSKETLP